MSRAKDGERPLIDQAVAGGVMGGDSVGQLQESPEPLLFAIAEEFDIHPVIGAAMPQMAIDTISKRWCRLVRSILGSSNAWKYSTKGAPIASTITTPPQFRNHSYYFKQILNC